MTPPMTHSEFEKAVREMYQRWRGGYAFNEDCDDDIILAERVDAALSALPQEPAATEVGGREFHWLCEDHPDLPMGHDGCLGAGIPSDTALSFCANQLKHAKQSLKEYKEQEILYGLSALREAEHG